MYFYAILLIFSLKIFIGMKKFPPQLNNSEIVSEDIQFHENELIDTNTSHLSPMTNYKFNKKQSLTSNDSYIQMENIIEETISHTDEEYDSVYDEMQEIVSSNDINNLDSLGKSIESFSNHNYNINEMEIQESPFDNESSNTFRGWQYDNVDNESNKSIEDEIQNEFLNEHNSSEKSTDTEDNENSNDIIFEELSNINEIEFNSLKRLNSDYFRPTLSIQNHSQPFKLSTNFESKLKVINNIDDNDAEDFTSEENNSSYESVTSDEFVDNMNLDFPPLNHNLKNLSESNIYSKQINSQLSHQIQIETSNLEDSLNEESLNSSNIISTLLDSNYKMEIHFPGLPIQLILHSVIEISSNIDNNFDNIIISKIIIGIKNISRHLVEIYVNDDSPILVNNNNILHLVKDEAYFSELKIVDSKKKKLKLELIPTEERGVYEYLASSTKKNASLERLDNYLLKILRNEVHRNSLFLILFEILKMRLCTSQSNILSLFVKNTIEENTKFIDDVLPPKGESISRINPLNLKWTQAINIYGEQMKLFSNETQKLEISHVYQGKLGDCYLLSAIVSLCQLHPLLIFNLFMTKELNSQGIYEVRLCYGGEWIKVQVDDHIPLNDTEDRAKYTYSKKSILWPTIIEKAYAKLYGDYLTLKRGKAENALTDLTGMPTKRIELKSIWKKVKTGEFYYQIQKYTEKKYPMSTSTNPNINKDKIGLGKGHAYSLLGVRTYTNSELGLLLLVKLRDPRGETGSKLPFNPKDPFWEVYPDIYHHFHHDHTNQEEFWISYSDFAENFHRISVCLVKSWKEKRARIFCNNGITNSFHLIIEEPNTDTHFMIHQMDKRAYNSQRYMPICVVVYDIHGNYCFDTSFGSKRTMRHPKFIFKKSGIYNIVPVVFSHEPRSMILSIHSTKKFKLIPEKNIALPLRISTNFDSLMLQALFKNGSILKTKKISGTVLQSWKWHSKRDIIYGLKLVKLGKNRLEVKIDFKVTLKNMTIVFGKESGQIILNNDNNIMFLFRCCASNSKKSSHKFEWTIKIKKAKKLIVKK